MADQRLEISTPLEGVNRLLARANQPANSVWDAQNVRPLDRYGRMRLAQRPGTEKLWTSAMGTGSQNVQFMQQVVTALDPNLILPDIEQLSIDFVNDVTPGTDANSIDLIAGGDSTFSVVNANSTSGNLSGELQTDGTTGRLVSTTFDTINGFVALYTDASLTIGDAFVLRATVRPRNTIAPGGCGVAAKISTTLANQYSLRLVLYTDRIQFEDANEGVATLTSAVSLSAPASADYELELRVNGLNIFGYVDGVLKIQHTFSSAPANWSNSGVGVYVGGRETSFSSNGIVDFTVLTARQLANFRQTNIVAVTGGSVYVGDIATQGTVATSGSGVLRTTGRVQGSDYLGKVYFVDGGVNDMQVLDIATQTVSTISVSAGSASASDLGNFQTAATWRGRLVIGADRDNPQNVWFSKLGDPTDWDFTEDAVGSAFALNASTSGNIGQPVVALMPFNDDILIIGTDNQLWAVRGDPTDGGTVEILSDGIGVVGPRAWTQAPDGSVYFVGTGGLYRMAPTGTVPENISRLKYNQFFADINRGLFDVQLLWDRDQQGMYIFVAPVNEGAATHLWYDERSQGFWPIVFPNSFGPTSAIVYDGDDPDDRVLLLGGRTGLIQQLTDDARTDDGTDINSYVEIGPIRAPFDDAVVTGIDMDLGELGEDDIANPDRWNMNLEIYAGDVAYEVMEGTPKSVVQVNYGRGGLRSKTLRQRQRGRYFLLRLSNGATNNYFSFERASMNFKNAGRARRL